MGRSSWRAGLAPALLLASSVGGCGPSSKPIVDTAPLTLVPERPGATDPALNFARWPDDEVFFITPALPVTGQTFQIREPVDSSVKDSGSAPAHDAYAALAGHFFTAEKEYLLQAYRDGSELWVGAFRDTPQQAVPLMPRVAGSADFFDVAAGDLDGMGTSDVEGNVDRQDELVIASLPYAKSKVQVSVLGLSGSPPDVSAQVARKTIAYTVQAPLETAYQANNVLAVAAGDFDGESDPRAPSLGRVKELAVAYVGAPNQLQVEAFRYSAAWNDVTHTVDTSLLSMATGTVTLPDVKALLDSVSLVAADFDGDGRDELAVGTAHHSITTGLHSVNLRLFRISGTIGKPMTIAQVRDIEIKSSPGIAQARVQLAAGLFKFDPDLTKGWGLTRRQLAVAYWDGNADELFVETIDLDTALAVAARSGPFVVTDPGAGRTFTLVAGGFRGALVRPPTPGHTDADPRWSLALSSWRGTAWNLSILQPGSAGSPPTETSSFGLTTSSGPTAASRLALAAFDLDGDGVYLGAPAHIVVENLIQADFILEEPPKHVFWHPTEKQVVNVSRLDDFNISLAVGDKQELSCTRTDNVSSAIGGSVTASASASVGAGANLGIVSASAEVTTEVSASFGYDYTQNESAMNSTFVGKTTETIGTTSRDDLVVGRIRTFDVWRYRIYGMTNTATVPYPFFDFVIPAPGADQKVTAGGATKDWYQPRHEPGNILSYAANDGAFQNPSDMPGPDAVFMESEGTNPAVTDPRIIRNESYTYSGVKDTVIVNFTSGGTNEISFSYNHALTANASIKTTASAEASAFGVKTAASGSLGFEAHGNYSWGGSGVNRTTTSRSTGLTLSVPEADIPQADYTLHPLVYVTGDGTIRATFAVTFPSDPGGYWYRLYSRPDLALNLPERFYVQTLGTGVIEWHPYRGDERKKMKGFLVRKADANPLTGEHGLIRPEVVPDTGIDHLVRLQANVYNYSLLGPVPTLDNGACFYLIEMVQDPVTYLVHEKERPGPGNLIGCATVPAIPPRGMVPVEVLWNTAGKSNGTTQDYRVYVRLDPENRLANETYDTIYGEAPDFSETCAMYDEFITTEQVCVDVDPGQNNEGYMPIKVVVNWAAGPEGKKPPHVGLPKDAMAGVDRRGRVVIGNVQAYVDRVFKYRVTVASDFANHGSSYLMVYDGEPERGGELIAMKEVLTGDPRGSSTWFEWMPTRIGAHRLYAKVLQKVDDPAPGGNVGMLKVEVIPAPPRPMR